VNASQQFFVRWLVEVMEKIGEQNEVVARSQGGLKCATSSGLVASGHSRLPCIALGYFQNLRPIERHNLRLGIVPRDGNPEKAVARGNIQNFERPRGIGGAQAGHKLRGKTHHASHGLREFDPDGMFRGGGPASRTN